MSLITMAMVPEPNAFRDTSAINSFAVMAPFEQFIPMVIALSLWLLSVFLFFEGISFHQEPGKFSALSKRIILGIAHLCIYSSVITVFYGLVFVVMTAGGPIILSPNKMLFIILTHDPLIFVPYLMLLSLYPSMSAMLRFSGLDYDISQPQVGRWAAPGGKFAARTGFFLSLTIFMMSIILLTFVFVKYSKT